MNKKNEIVPFTGKPLVPGKGGGLRYWRQERDNQRLKNEVADLAKVMRRLSQELVEELLFLKDPVRKSPEATHRRMSQIMGALRSESTTLTSLFDIGDLHPALQRIFAERSGQPQQVTEPFIDLALLEAPAPTAEKTLTLLHHLLSNLDIEVLTYFLAGHKHKKIAAKLGITKEAVSHHLSNVRKKASSLVGEIEAPAPTLENTPTLLDDLFSGREMEILTHLIAGSSQKKIAAKLGISAPAINYHVQNLRKKACAFVGQEGEEKP